jgi:hypothetical protein
MIKEVEELRHAILDDVLNASDRTVVAISADMFGKRDPAVLAAQAAIEAEKKRGVK